LQVAKNKQTATQERLAVANNSVALANKKKRRIDLVGLKNRIWWGLTKHSRRDVLTLIIGKGKVGSIMGLWW
jgi:hypothetical protein